MQITDRILYLDISGLTGQNKRRLLDFLTLEHKKIVPKNEVYYRLNNTGTTAKVKVSMTQDMRSAFRTNPRLQSILISDHGITDVPLIRANDRTPEWNY